MPTPLSRPSAARRTAERVSPPASISSYSQLQLLHCSGGPLQLQALQALQDAGREAHEVLSLCQMLEWQKHGGRCGQIATAR